MTTGIKTATVDMKLEIVVIPVSDVDRAKQFYSNLGWRLDADFAAFRSLRVSTVARSHNITSRFG